MSVENTPSLDDIVQRVGRGISAAKKIRVRVSAQTALAGVMLEMHQTGLLREPGEAAEGMIVPEPSGSGKTTTAEKVRRQVARSRGIIDETRGPVRIITLSEQGTPGSFWSSILEHLGDPHYATGSEKVLKKRLRKALLREGVELLIIDELNHITDKRHAAEIINAVKNMLTLGWVPIIVMGTNEELAKLPRNDAFEIRLIDCPRLSAMRWASDAAAWTKFCQDLDHAMVDAKIVRTAADLGDEARARALCELCSGIIGRLVWVISSALRPVLRRDADGIGLEDLVAAGNALLVKYPRAGAVNPLEALRGSRY